MRSLFQEQIEPEANNGPLAIEGIAEDVAPFPVYADYQMSPGQYLHHSRS